MFSSSRIVNISGNSKFNKFLKFMRNNIKNPQYIDLGFLQNFSYSRCRHLWGESS